MALSKAKVREILSAAGVDSEHMSTAVDAIIDGNVASIEALREDVAKYKADAEKLEAVQKELNALKANSGDDWKSKYEKEHDAFEKYKKGVTEKETKAAKEKAVREYVSGRDFGGKTITGDNLEIAMMALEGKIDGLELDGDKIKETPELESLVSKLGRLSTEKVVKGAETANPPANNGGSKLTKADIYAKDEHGRYKMSTAERQKALAENPELLN